MRKIGEIDKFCKNKRKGTIIIKDQTFNFFGSDFVFELELLDLRKGTLVAFDPDKNNGKLAAKNIEVSDEIHERYATPTAFQCIEGRTKPGFMILESTKLQCSKPTATEYEAREMLIFLAKRVRA
ncbi:MAG: hypothetical protein JKY54_07140, partial [Flavobacteriales bacterium]|nr:hypothetical protein [Flavobacteriales bacterium]